MCQPPLTIIHCQCGYKGEWKKYRNVSIIQNLWACPKCGHLNQPPTPSLALISEQFN